MSVLTNVNATTTVTPAKLQLCVHVCTVQEYSVRRRFSANSSTSHAQLCSLFSRTFLASLYQVYFDNRFHNDCQSDEDVRVTCVQKLKLDCLNFQFKAIFMQQCNTGKTAWEIDIFLNCVNKTLKF